MAAGLFVGLSAGLGWRYTVPRAKAIADSPPFPYPEGGVYFIRVNYWEYVDGPGWWPVVILVAIGGLVGAAGGCAGGVMSGAAQPPDRRLTVAVAGAVGALVGVWGVVMAQWQQPRIWVSNGDGITPDGYNEGVGLSGLEGAPPYWDLGPTAVTFPLIGAAAGALLGATTLLAVRTHHVWGAVDDDATAERGSRVSIDTAGWLFAILSSLVAFGLKAHSVGMTRGGGDFCDPVYTSVAERDADFAHAQNFLILGCLIMIAIGALIAAIITWKRNTLGPHRRLRLTLANVVIAVAIVVFAVLIATSAVSADCGDLLVR
ncbi:hypothetical protein [Gordonia terrae]|uniref:hypothetical protein n=1 Tax=Gordonia terrae TaxID=2055 RepID=UPI003F6AECAE